jgi:hypothetical protein
MDMAFFRRNAFNPAVLDLATLLARTSAAQAGTPTARAQMQIEGRSVFQGHADARVDLFGRPEAHPAPQLGASFAAIFSPHQPV